MQLALTLNECDRIAINQYRLFIHNLKFNNKGLNCFIILSSKLDQGQALNCEV